jgi:hypothetical protein
MVMDLCVRSGPTQLGVTHYDLIRTGKQNNHFIDVHMSEKLRKYEMVVRYSNKCALKITMMVLKVTVCAKDESVVVEMRS